VRRPFFRRRSLESHHTGGGGKRERKRANGEKEGGVVLRIMSSNTSVDRTSGREGFQPYPKLKKGDRNSINGRGDNKKVEKGTKGTKGHDYQM